MSIGENLFERRRATCDIPHMSHDDLNRLLARNLESLMEEKGLNASAWAKDAGLGHTAVRDIIHEKVKNPTYRTLLRLADVAGVDVRRITVGPNYLQADDELAETLDVLHQLDPAIRRFLLNAAKAELSDQGQPRRAVVSDKKAS